MFQLVACRQLSSLLCLLSIKILNMICIGWCYFYSICLLHNQIFLFHSGQIWIFGAQVTSLTAVCCNPTALSCQLLTFNSIYSLNFGFLEPEGTTFEWELWRSEGWTWLIRPRHTKLTCGAVSHLGFPPWICEKKEHSTKCLRRRARPLLLVQTDQWIWNLDIGDQICHHFMSFYVPVYEKTNLCD